MDSLNYTELKLDRLRKLRYPIPALRDVERLMGKPLNDILTGFWQLSVEPLGKLLWVGLREDGGRQLTEERVLELVDAYLQDGGEISDIRKAINDAIALSGYLGQKARREAAGLDPPPPAPVG